MLFLHVVAYCLGGAFLANSVPHVVQGISGRPFQSPFARPSGVGLSPPITNVLWGFANLVVGYLLIWHVGNFDLRIWIDALASGVGAFAIALFAAWHFGRINESKTWGSQ